jgi:capsular exopolysaccharide synthesis family protein
MIQSGKRVILIDTDMRIPKVHTLLELPNVKGLSNVLRRSASLDQAIQVSRIPGLNVITSGPTPSDPTELLASPVMKVVLNELMNRYDIVLMDTPAFLPVADVAVLAPMVDGIVVVVRRSYIRQDAIREMCKQLGKIKARKYGVVVNAAEANGHYYYYKPKQ